MIKLTKKIFVLIVLAESGGSGGVTQKEFNSLKKSNEKLQEENNVLKFKIDILLDMVSALWAH